MRANYGVAFRALLLLWLFIPISGFAQGGPPMVADDPGTPGNGNWEINIASLDAWRPNHDLMQFPYFDINYGLGDHLQLKVETGWATHWESGNSMRNGMGAILTGVKFRFLDEEKSGMSISTYPQVQFRPNFSSKDSELAEPENEYLLPLEFSKTFGDWEINPEIGYLFAKTNLSQLVYGVVVAFEKAKPWEPLFEIHEATDLYGTGTQSLLNLGFRYACNPRLNLIGALGYTVTHFSGALAELDSYLGIQLEL